MKWLRNLANGFLRLFGIRRDSNDPDSKTDGRQSPAAPSEAETNVEATAKNNPGIAPVVAPTVGADISPDEMILAVPTSDIIAADLPPVPDVVSSENTVPDISNEILLGVPISEMLAAELPVAPESQVNAASGAVPSAAEGEAGLSGNPSVDAAGSTTDQGVSAGVSPSSPLPTASAVQAFNQFDPAVLSEMLQGKREHTGDVNAQLNMNEIANIVAMATNPRYNKDVGVPEFVAFIQDRFGVNPDANVELSEQNVSTLTAIANLYTSAKGDIAQMNAVHDQEEANAPDQWLADEERWALEGAALLVGRPLNGFRQAIKNAGSFELYSEYKQLRKEEKAAQKELADADAALKKSGNSPDILEKRAELLEKAEAIQKSLDDWNKRSAEAKSEKKQTAASTPDAIDQVTAVRKNIFSDDDIRPLAEEIAKMPGRAGQDLDNWNSAEAQLRLMRDHGVTMDQIAQNEWLIGEKNPGQSQFENRRQAIQEITAKALAEQSPLISAPVDQPQSAIPESVPQTVNGEVEVHAATTPAAEAPQEFDTISRLEEIAQKRRAIEDQSVRQREAQRKLQLGSAESNEINIQLRDLSEQDRVLGLEERDLQSRIKSPLKEINLEYERLKADIEARQKILLEEQESINARRADIRKQMAARPKGEQFDALSAEYDAAVKAKVANENGLLALETERSRVDAGRKEVISEMAKKLEAGLKDASLKSSDRRRLQGYLDELKRDGKTASGRPIAEHESGVVAHAESTAVRLQRDDRRLERDFEKLMERSNALKEERARLEAEGKNTSGSPEWADYERRQNQYQKDRAIFDQKDSHHEGGQAQHESAQAKRPVVVGGDMAKKPAVPATGDLPLHTPAQRANNTAGSAGQEHGVVGNLALKPAPSGAPHVDLPLHDAAHVATRGAGSASAAHTPSVAAVRASVGVNTGMGLFNMWNRWRNGAEDMAAPETRKATQLGYAADTAAITGDAISGLGKFAGASKVGGVVGGAGVVVGTGVEFYNAAKTGDATRAAGAFGGLVGGAGGMSAALIVTGLFSGVGTIPTLIIVGGSAMAAGYLGAKKGASSQSLKDHYSALFGVDEKLAAGIASGISPNLAKSLDKNKDGKVGLDELKSGLESRGVTSVRQIDLNKDGKTSADEISLALRFRMAHNGVISPELAKQVLDGKREDGRIFTRQELFARNKGTHDNVIVAEAPKDGLISVASKLPNGSFEMKIYRANTEGGYTVVPDGYKSSKTGDFSHIYMSEEGKKYKFDARFGAEQTALNIYQHREGMEGKYGIGQDGYALAGTNKEPNSSFNAAANPAAVPAVAPSVDVEHNKHNPASKLQT